jgi:hypothetical protein
MDIQLTLSEMAPACLRDEAQDLRDMARLDGVPDELFHLITREKPEPWADFRAARDLLAMGWERADVTKAAGLNKQAMDRILAIANVIPALACFKAAAGTWGEIAKLHPYVQERLASMAAGRKSSRLTSKDVHTATRAQRDEAAQVLPSFFGKLPGWADPRAAVVQAPTAAIRTFTLADDVKAGDIVAVGLDGQLHAISR